MNATDEPPRWNGPRCESCKGTGVAYFSGYIDGATEPGYYATCPACNGHGREPS